MRTHSTLAVALAVLAAVALPACEAQERIVGKQGERIYHTADSGSYRNTDIDKSRGAGWRASGARRSSL